MKRAFLYFFACITFAASFQNSLFIVDYQINRNFYETHCINRAKPQLNCHGKCMLKKETEKTDKAFTAAAFAFAFVMEVPHAVSVKFEAPLSFQLHEKIIAKNEGSPSDGLLRQLSPPPREFHSV